VLKKILTARNLLIFIWAVAILLRLQNVQLLPIDAHPMRQTDTESVAFYFATADANPLHPQASLIRPQTNTKGFFFLEFPAYQYILSLFYRVFGTSVIVARIYNLFLFSLSFWLMYRFVSNYFSKALALWSVVIYTLIPSSLFFFGHAIHPDIFAITTVLLSAYLLSQPKQKLIFTLFAGLVFAISVGTRPFILMALPSLLSIAYFRKAKWWEYLYLILSSVSIYGLWSWWQSNFPEADHSWQYWTLQGRETLYTFEGWKFLIWRNTSGEVLGRVASALAGIGMFAIFAKYAKHLALYVQSRKLGKLIRVFFSHILRKPQVFSSDLRLMFVCLPWLAAVPLYWWIAPAGNAAHQYYANVFVLPVILFAAKGALSLTEFARIKQLQIIVSVIIVIGLLYNGIRTSSYFYNNIIPPHHLTIAQEIQTVIPEGEKLVYLATNNSIPFSLAHRQGWMLGGTPTDVGSTAESILGMKQYGAKYAVWARANNDLPESELMLLEEKSEIIYESETVTIYRL
jgi:4-amino-4-deoxy-L-arabinose transferase-like glycosyltransferase